MPRNPKTILSEIKGLVDELEAAMGDGSPTHKKSSPKPKIPKELEIKVVCFVKHHLTPRMRLEKIPAPFSRYLTRFWVFDNIVIQTITINI